MKAYTCPHCGEEFENKSDLMMHLKIDNCEVQVQQQIEIHEVRNGEAHQADLATQGKYGVDYKQYWYNDQDGTVFCLVEAPNAARA